MRTIRRKLFKILLWAVPVGIGLAVILTVASILFGLVTGGRYMGNQGAMPTEQPQSPAVPSLASEMPPAGGVEAKASGCLSRANDPAVQLTQTQAAAGPTAVGAAEFAGAWLRWGMTSPIPRYDELLATTTMNPAAIKALNSGTGNPTTATLQGGMYEVTELSPTVATVKVGVNWAGAGGQQDYQSGWSTFHLIYEGGMWRVNSIDKAGVAFNEFAKNMTPYASGC